MTTQPASIRVTAWSNGSPLPTGAGYGVKLSHRDRDKYFDPGWDEVIIDLDQGEKVPVSLSDSFWRSCSELRSAAIGRWLLRNSLAPWSRGAPPTVLLSRVGGNWFSLSRLP
jgi:hypothetical protein